MPLPFDTLNAFLAHRFDTVIDVRSPAEFAEDHVPGAINLPALSNTERAEVGTIYKQVSAFDARKIGAAMVARNVAHAIETTLAAKDGAWQPLVYCWRGGQRSGSFASILQQIGWRAETVQGGYQQFRRLVHRALYEDLIAHRMILLDGNTGTAKTALLAQLKKRGIQTLDLEGLAGHRGSLLGATAAGQPSQRSFESALAVALADLDPNRPVVIEAESSKIGKINLPKMLWQAMIAAPRIMVAAPLDARATYLAQAYRDVIDKPEALIKRLGFLRGLRGHETVDHWLKLFESNDYQGFAKAIMQDHYDPAYARSRQIDDKTILGTVTATTLDDAGLERAADDLKTLINAAR